MPGHRCIVPACTSGNDSCIEKRHFFTVPKDPIRLAQWTKAIPRKDFVIKPMQVVCELHFQETSIIRKKIMTDTNGKVLAEALYKIPRLQEGAVPSIFPNCPKYLTKHLKPRKAPLQRKSPIKRKRKAIVSQNPENEFMSVNDECLNNTEPDQQSTAILFSFWTIQENASSVSLPTGWSRHDIPGKLIMFSLYITVENDSEMPTPIIFKRVCLNINLKAKCSVLNKEISKDVFGIQEINSSTVLEELLNKFDSTNICKGYKVDSYLQTQNSYVDLTGNVRHIMCQFIIEIKDICQYCTCAMRSVNRKKLRMSKNISTPPERINSLLSSSKQPQLKRLQMKYKLIRQKKIRAQALNKKLKNDICNLQDKMSTFSLNLEDVLPFNQRIAVNEIVSASKVKNKKGRRYSENWSLLCMLFHLRSPCGYNFLLKNDILPLPCVRSIRRHLSCIDTKCGFDKKFLELFALHLAQKDSFKRHGILIFDEMATRESVSVNSENLTYTGLIDFGDDGDKGKSFNDKANHGLVFMFVPLTDSYAQPVGVFASKGPTKGVVIAQLILKAISLLENAGAFIHGIVCDGAAPNRKFWTEMGISGKLNEVKNWFEHPNDPNRKIFIFSDTPHLFKNVRNRLYNKKELLINPDEPLVKWNHFQIVHDQDKLNNGELRVCPKISASHLTLNSSAKMRVRLAVQILSNSMAKGLEFYRPYCSRLEDSSATEEFCLKMNATFDALNRKLVNEGVSPNSEDYMVLQSTLKWLDNWEQQVVEKCIKPDHFLTNNTAEGLRVTLISSMQICCYLKEKYGMHYVLTGKINQDALERFFGTVRQAGGANDHPATPTFLQLYKMLSVYSVLKPPKTGNCIVENNEPIQSLISLESIKNIYKNPEKKSVLNTIREKLDFAIEQEDWTVDEVIENNDHDYFLAPVVDCVIYYVTGYLCKQILRYVKCDVCSSAIKQSNFSSEPVARLTNIKSRGFLLHPNKNFFNLICKIEDLFSQYCMMADVCELVLEELLDNNILYFPCFQHSEQVISFCIRYYINMRMRQFSQKHNAEVKKDNMSKKKAAKFTKT